MTRVVLFCAAMNATPLRLAPWTVLACVLALLAPAAARASFVTFDTGSVRPLAMSPDGTRLFAANTPDNRVEVFSLTSGTPVHTSSVEVGLEPVAIAARNDSEIWVVNHLSDSVSIVDVAASPPRVVRTLLVGDEPRDIVFAGPGRNRAFITTAHRGQNNPNDPQLTTPGVGRADVWVFDATALGAPLGGTPVTIVTLFGDTPRALATDPSGQTVYAAVFHSGNQTTTVTEQAVCDGFDSAGPCNVHGVIMPGGLPPPDTNADGVPAPEVGLIVKYNKAVGQWQDELGRNWNNAVKFNLPDYDVFAIDAMANPPVGGDRYASVGTILFNMAVNPVNGKVYVTNTEARNEVRFEGPGIFGGTTVRGHLHEARITVIDPSLAPSSAVTPRHLNKHIDYDVVPSPPGTAEKSLATPLEMAVTSNGATLYVAAFGSSKIGVFSTAALENDSFVPSSASHIEVSGGGPAGIVLDEARGRLYALTRFDNGLSVIDTGSASEIAHLPLYNPEPAKVRDGRPFLYDARNTSSNGEASCASCHIFNDFDSLAWDLGNPDDEVLPNLNPFRVNDPLGTSFPDHHPMKGPMTTQSLRGMANHGPMHWRGDRSGANDVPATGALNEKTGFMRFNPAFEGLLGRSSQISPADMAAFADFILEVTYPPNPIRNLDNSLTPDQQAGRNFYFSVQPSDVFQTCNGCHVLNPAAGFFGSDGFSSFEFEAQLLKVPHLRNMYQKIGMFGMPSVPFVNSGDNGHKGDQVRGFGFLHDGSFDTLFRFHNAQVFNQTNPAGLPVANPGGFPNGPAGDPLRRQVEAFMFVFDSNLAPIVGQQATVTATSDASVTTRVELLAARAAAGECDLVVKGVLDGEARGWVRLPNGSFQSDRAADAPVSLATLQAQASVAGQQRTFTCVPPGSGDRIGIDRDEDDFFDRDELDAGTDPANPESYPGAVVVHGIRTASLVLNDDPAPPLDPRKRKIRFRSAKRGAIPSGVVLPAQGGDGDPTLHGASLIIYRPDGGGTTVTIPLPSSNWSARGGTPAKRYVYSDPKGLLGPIRSVQMSATTLAVRGIGAELFSLENAPQGAMALRLQFGSEIQLCAAAPARKTGNPPSSHRHDDWLHFTGAPNTPAPSPCPPLPVVGSASQAFLVETPSLVGF
jgi:DNA-binding beta-propeller fold protein YncE